MIQELIDGRVLEPLGDGSWRFRHELLREVAAELSPPSVRRRLHSRVADALVAASAGNHRLAGRRRSLRASRALRRGRIGLSSAHRGNAQRRGAIEEARGYLTHALAQVEQHDDRARSVIGARSTCGCGAASCTRRPKGRRVINAAADFERCLQLRESGAQRRTARNIDGAVRLLRDTGGSAPCASGPRGACKRGSAAGRPRLGRH